MPRCWLRLARLGFGAISNLAVGPFEHMMARVCQRGSVRGPTGAMVCRLRVAMAGCRPPSLRAPKMDEDGQIVAFFRWWPPSTLLDGPGETLNGSVRPRRASLRPDGVRTVPTAPGRDPRVRKGVNPRRDVACQTRPIHLLTRLQAHSIHKRKPIGLDATFGQNPPFSSF